MNNSITLRKFPYPFKCALAICSDIDATLSTERFVELQKFLCTDEQTSSGKGLSLEVGNSFWFFRNSDHPGISYFNKLTNEETSFAPICRELIKSGHADVLHTYGDFNLGGFKRKYAEKAIGELLKYNLKLKTWVNHGNKLNSQNIGGLKEFSGATFQSESYNLDLLKDYGMKYFWTSQLTHLVGQDSKFNSINFFKNQLQKLLAIKYYRKQVPPFFSNKLMDKIKQFDGSEINSFMRFINPWGKYSYTDAENLPNQLSTKVIKELISNEGFMILYTHLGNYDSSTKILPKATTKTLRRLANENRYGNIFITTTTRLLTYYEIFSSVIISYKMMDNKNLITLSFNGNLSPNIDDLQGLTFYSDNPLDTEIFYQNKLIQTEKNGIDFTGRLSVSIPWKKLDFPEGL